MSLRQLLGLTTDPWMLQLKRAWHRARMHGVERNIRLVDYEIRAQYAAQDELKKELLELWRTMP